MSMLEVGRLVAKHLNDLTENWPHFEAVAIPHNSDMVGLTSHNEDSQFQIEIRHDVKEKTIVVTGAKAKATDGAEYPHSFDCTNPRIRMTDRSDALRIAKEINRRFLADYRAEFTRGIMRRDEHNEYVAKQAANLAMFAKRSGGTISGELVNIKGVRRWQVAADTVHLEIGSVPIEMAKHILDLVLTEIMPESAYLIEMEHCGRWDVVGVHSGDEEGAKRLAESIHAKRSAKVRVIKTLSVTAYTCG